MRLFHWTFTFVNLWILYDIHVIVLNLTSSTTQQRRYDPAFVKSRRKYKISSEVVTLSRRNDITNEINERSLPAFPVPRDSKNLTTRSWKWFRLDTVYPMPFEEYGTTLVQSYSKILNLIDEYQAKSLQLPENITFAIGALQVSVRSPVPVGHWDMVREIVAELKHLALATLADFGYMIFWFGRFVLAQLIFQVVVNIIPHFREVPRGANHLING